mgnify:CR=1 FL=1
MNERLRHELRLWLELLLLEVQNRVLILHELPLLLLQRLLREHGCTRRIGCQWLLVPIRMDEASPLRTLLVRRRQRRKLLQLLLVKLRLLLHVRQLVRLQWQQWLKLDCGQRFHFDCRQRLLLELHHRRRSEVTSVSNARPEV